MALKIQYPLSFKKYMIISTLTINTQACIEEASKNLALCRNCDVPRLRQ